MSDPISREADRLAALACYEVMDTPREPSFDEIAALTAKLCEAPIAVVNLIGDGRQFFKAEVGLGVRETPLESSFCAKALLEEDFLLVPDATRDPRFDCNPLVTGEPHIRFYAGALLKTAEGQPIGTLCVLDYRPRDLTALQQETIRVLARQVMAQLDLRRAVQRARATLRQRPGERGTAAADPRQRARLCHHHDRQRSPDHQLVGGRGGDLRLVRRGGASAAPSTISSRPKIAPPGCRSRRSRSRPPTAAHPTSAGTSAPTGRACS